ncbi:hypothetical protein TRFO_18415 [Tritrichomonas foetus]|uniref:Uncharacterized protein n=1 Tax=Tritrichomonas foetus TaxID=1144522 RepID=A0A1J4KL31_9EUKA|nr:hypothetical protein TRFO_18415 [Tritrichomonas foetus]|eukprot:OHT11939.1 hypothetical protein TRFO_18415 [Tritrichomonas foetus]
MKAHKVDEALNFLNEMISIHRNPDALFLMGIIFKDPKRLLNYFEPFPLLFDIIYLLEQNTAKNIDQSIYFFEKALLGNFFYAQFEIEDIFLNTKCVNLNNSVALQLNQQLALIRTAMEYYLIGIHYFIGYGVNQNIELSIKFLSIAANHNIPSAQYILGMIFFRQDDNTIDFNKKIQSISYFELASNVNPNAAFFLGNLHEYANDIPKAVIYYEKAANLIPKNINAMCFVGNIFSEKKYENLGVINYQKAFYYHKMAAQRNNPSGQFMISQYFLFGIGVAKNIQKCIQYLTLFINNPSHDILIRNSEKTSNHYKAKALISLFYLYYTGTGVPPNFSRALYYLILGAELKLPEVFSVLGYFCLHGELCPIDYEKALYYFESSKQIDGSLFHLGEMYLYGKGVVKDYLKAKYYFKLGCKHNHDYCMFSLLELYIDINDYKKQFKLCKKLISLFEQNERTNKFNYAKTLIYLGNLYENGYVIKKDIDKAVECYQKAINIGYYNAYSDIARIYQTKSSGKYNIHKCLNYLKSGSRYGCIISKYQLSVFYLEGKKVRKKTNKAINYLEQISNLSLDQDVSFDDDFFGDFYPVNFSKKRKLAPVKINPEFIKTYKIRSSTLLAMIYLFEFSKIDLALKYFCEISSFNSSALNYMGLIWYYFYKDINKAEFYFMQATQNQNIFAFINLGKLKEEKGEIKTAMKLYKYVLHHKKELIQQDIFIERKLKYILKTVNSFLLWVNLKLYLFYTKSKKESKIRKYYDAVLEMIKQNNAIHNFLYNFHSPNFADKLKNGLETIIFSYPYTMLFRYRFISHKNSYQLSIRLNMIILIFQEDYYHQTTKSLTNSFLTNHLKSKYRIKLKF